MLYHTPIIQALTATGFQRGILLAKSLKAQRQYLTKAKIALKEKDVFKARNMLGCWKDERNSWKALVSFQGKKASSVCEFI